MSVTYVVLITAVFEQRVNGSIVYFQPNTTYPLVEANRVIRGLEGIVRIYNVATVNETETEILEDYCTIIDEQNIPVHENERDKYLEERTDATTGYIQAYADRLNIIVNPYCDVDRDSWIDPLNNTREDPEE